MAERLNSLERDEDMLGSHESASPLKVLFVNHTGAASGAEFALLAWSGPCSATPVAVACPRPAPGQAARRGRGGADLLPLRGQPAPRSGPDPGRAGTPLAPGVALAGAAQRFGADLVHANTPRRRPDGEPGARPGRPPLVVRAHEALPRARSAGSASVLAWSASAV